jgi:DNA-binding response OmpR family regulator
MVNVLVIDDDKDLLDMVEMVLASYDFHVSVLNHAAPLFETVKQKKPNVILMDIYLGDADGRQLCYTLKTSAEFARIPVILYSAGFISPTTIQESLADDFLPKPFDNAQLVERLRALAS